MTDRREPPLDLELPELCDVYQRAAEINDPQVYRILDAIVKHRQRDYEKRLASEIIRLADGPEPAA